uniref:Candidate secreted effector n=1 Tax=Meloidogyne incognita TaxID=6306 RepID=A0A914M3U3_MELIC
MSSTIFNVNNVKRTRVAFTMSNNTNTSHVVTTSNHTNISRIKFNVICNLSSVDINSDGVVNL